jgi:hypothetical protein
MGSTGVASANPRAVGECSNCSRARTSTVSDEIAAPGFEQAIRDSDANVDGRLCTKIIPNDGGPPQFDLTFVYLDNKI